MSRPSKKSYAFFFVLILSLQFPFIGYAKDFSQLKSEVLSFLNAPVGKTNYFKIQSLAEEIYALPKEEYQDVLNEFQTNWQAHTIRNWKLLNQIQKLCETDQIKIFRNNEEFIGASIGLGLLGASIIRNPKQIPKYFQYARYTFPLGGTLFGISQEKVTIINQNLLSQKAIQPCPSQVLEFQNERFNSLNDFDREQRLDLIATTGSIAAVPFVESVLHNGLRIGINVVDKGYRGSLIGSRGVKQLLIASAIFSGLKKAGERFDEHLNIKSLKTNLDKERKILSIAQANSDQFTLDTHMQNFVEHISDMYLYFDKDLINAFSDFQTRLGKERKEVKVKLFAKMAVKQLKKENSGHILGAPTASAIYKKIEGLLNTDAQLRDLYYQEVSSIEDYLEAELETDLKRLLQEINNGKDFYSLMNYKMIVEHAQKENSNSSPYLRTQKALENEFLQRFNSGDYSKHPPLLALQAHLFLKSLTSPVSQYFLNELPEAQVHMQIK